MNYKLLKRHSVAVILALTSSLIGCASILNKSSASQLTYYSAKAKDGTYHISVYGPTGTNLEDIQKALLRKCAEVTLSNGFAFFARVQEGQAAVGTYSKEAINRPMPAGMSYHIKLYQEEPAYQGAYDAKTILANH